jgi:SAM-dependent methyltransferase
VLEHVHVAVTAIENDATLDTRTKVLVALRRIGLDDFAEVLWTIPNSTFPRISALLPSMVDDKVQKAWTGASGVALIRGTTAFVRAIASQYARLIGRSLSGASMLDFGCGYGRIARLMYYFSTPDCVFGVDPWQKAVALCREQGLGNYFLKSEYLPRSLPLPRADFALIYAFSVFTHLSRRAALVCLQTIRNHIASHGLLAITIRPVEYWQFAVGHLGMDAVLASGLEAQHRSTGFAFSSHNRELIEGEVTYGDTSMTLGWLEANAINWRIECIDRCLDDQLQIYVFLRPA